MNNTMMTINDLDGIEMSITIATSNHNPNFLNLNFLIENGIVPEEWSNGQENIYTDNTSQVVFDGKVNIVNYKSKINFIESIDFKSLSNVDSPTIALRYTNVLAKLIDINYLTIDINFKGYIIYPQYSDLPHRYIFETLVRPPIQDWTEVGSHNLQGSLSFFYSFTNRELKLSIDEAMLKTGKEMESPILLFTGNFNYNISSKNNHNLENKSVKDCREVLEWSNDLEIYQKIVNQLLRI
jgi:hypothetical protein